MKNLNNNGDEVSSQKNNSNHNMDCVIQIQLNLDNTHLHPNHNMYPTRT